MKVIMNAVFGFALVLSALACVDAAEKYTTKYDSIDLQDILQNKRLLKGYVNCLLDKGPCSPDGAELKKVLPDAIKTECSKCSEKQQSGSRTVLRHLVDKEPAYWSELEKKYDSSGEFRIKYKAEAKKEGINI